VAGKSVSHHYHCHSVWQGEAGVGVYGDTAIMEMDGVGGGNTEIQGYRR